MSEHNASSSEELESWRVLKELYPSSDFKIFWNVLRTFLDRVDDAFPDHPFQETSVDLNEIKQHIFEVLKKLSKGNNFIEINSLKDTLEIIIKTNTPDGQTKQAKYFLAIKDIPNNNFAHKLKKVTDPWQMLKMVSRYFVDDQSYQDRLNFIKASGAIAGSVALKSSGVAAVITALPLPDSFSAESKPATVSGKIEVKKPLGAPEWFFRNMNLPENALSRERISEIGDTLISLSEKYPWLRFINTAKEKTKAVEICGIKLAEMIAAYTSEFPDQLPPIIRSSFRTMEEQEIIWSLASEEMKQGGWVAEPGMSEHHLGLAIDFSINRNGGNDFIRDGDHFYIWLKNNAYKFGFVQSYTLPNRTFAVEPWHWRYVGIELAKVWHEKQPNSDMEYILANVEEKNDFKDGGNDPVMAVLSKIFGW